MGESKDLHEVYPGLSGPEARKRMERDQREALKAKRERAKLEERMKSRERMTHGTSKAIQAQAEERRRVDHLLKRDRENAAQDRDRELAREIERNGGKVSESEIADGPTAEQLSEAGPGGFRKVAEVGRGDAREGATVYRRMSVSTARRMHDRGQIDADQLKVCEWYDLAHERAGLKGRIGSVDLQKEVFASPTARAMFTPQQLEAQDEWRFVRSRMTTSKLKFFDAIVIKGIPLGRAMRFAQKGRPGALRLFRQLCDAAFSAAEEIGALD